MSCPRQIFYKKFKNISSTKRPNILTY